MVATGAIATAEPAGGRGDGPVPSGPRTLRPRGSLPGGRAVVGGLLVAAAAVGLFAASTAATANHGRDYAVAARELRAGEVLSPDDVALRRMDLPGSLGERAFTAAGELVGQVLVAPVADGELVQRSAVVDAGRPGTHELSFSVARDRAVDGALEVGERVDVLATYGTGADASTELVARRAVVVAGSSLDGGISGEAIVLTVALETPDEVLAVTHAVRAGEITVVRSTAAADSQPASATYRPFESADDGDSAARG